MSYDIFIGNAELKTYTDEDGKPERYEIVVEHMTHPDAPVFPHDEMTGNGNSRHPGYSAWSDFCERTKLHSLFFNREDGLMFQHPGNAALNAKHQQIIHEALERWQQKHPHATPQFGEVADQDAILARLIWLDWWITYALEQCERPCIYNY